MCSRRTIGWFSAISEKLSIQCSKPNWFFFLNYWLFWKSSKKLIFLPFLSDLRHNILIIEKKNCIFFLLFSVVQIQWSLAHSNQKVSWILLRISEGPLYFVWTFNTQQNRNFTSKLTKNAKCGFEIFCYSFPIHIASFISINFGKVRRPYVRLLVIVGASFFFAL